MDLISKKECVEFLRLEKELVKLTDADLESPKKENEKIMMTHLDMVEKFESMNVNPYDFCRYYELIK